MSRASSLLNIVDQIAKSAPKAPAPASKSSSVSGAAAASKAPIKLLDKKS